LPRQLTKKTKQKKQNKQTQKKRMTSKVILYEKEIDWKKQHFSGKVRRKPLF